MGTAACFLHAGPLRTVAATLFIAVMAASRPLTGQEVFARSGSWSQHGRSRVDCESHDSQRISLEATPCQINHGSGLRKRIFKIPIPQHYEESLVSFQAA
jgi:hypothetical protein